MSCCSCSELDSRINSLSISDNFLDTLFPVGEVTATLKSVICKVKENIVFDQAMFVGSSLFQLLEEKKSPETITLRFKVAHSESLYQDLCNLQRDFGNFYGDKNISPVWNKKGAPPIFGFSIGRTVKLVFVTTVEHDYFATCDSLQLKIGNDFSLTEVCHEDKKLWIHDNQNKIISVKKEVLEKGLTLFLHYLLTGYRPSTESVDYFCGCFSVDSLIEELISTYDREKKVYVLLDLFIQMKKREKAAEFLQKAKDCFGPSCGSEFDFVLCEEKWIGYHIKKSPEVGFQMLAESKNSALQWKFLDAWVIHNRLQAEYIFLQLASLRNPEKAVSSLHLFQDQKHIIQRLIASNFRWQIILLDFSEMRNTVLYFWENSVDSYFNKVLWADFEEAGQIARLLSASESSICRIHAALYLLATCDESDEQLAKNVLLSEIQDALSVAISIYRKTRNEKLFELLVEYAAPSHETLQLFEEKKCAHAYFQHCKMIKKTKLSEYFFCSILQLVTRHFSSQDAAWYLTKVYGQQQANFPCIQAEIFIEICMRFPGQIQENQAKKYIQMLFLSLSEIEKKFIKGKISDSLMRQFSAILYQFSDNPVCLFHNEQNPDKKIEHLVTGSIIPSDDEWQSLINMATDSGRNKALAYLLDRKDHIDKGVQEATWKKVLSNSQWRASALILFAKNISYIHSLIKKDDSCRKWLVECFSSFLKLQNPCLTEACTLLMLIERPEQELYWQLASLLKPEENSELFKKVCITVFRQIEMPEKGSAKKNGIVQKMFLFCEKNSHHAPGEVLKFFNKCTAYKEQLFKMFHKVKQLDILFYFFPIFIPYFQSIQKNHNYKSDKDSMFVAYAESLFHARSYDELKRIFLELFVRQGSHVLEDDLGQSQHLFAMTCAEKSAPVPKQHYKFLNSIKSGYSELLSYASTDNARDILLIDFGRKLQTTRAFGEYIEGGQYMLTTSHVMLFFRQLAQYGWDKSSMRFFSLLFRCFYIEYGIKSSDGEDQYTQPSFIQTNGHYSKAIMASTFDLENASLASTNAYLAFIEQIISCILSGYSQTQSQVEKEVCLDFLAKSFLNLRQRNYSYDLLRNHQERFIALVPESSQELYNCHRQMLSILASVSLQ